jgi:hypothetical protein
MRTDIIIRDKSIPIGEETRRREKRGWRQRSLLVAVAARSVFALIKRGVE